MAEYVSNGGGATHIAKRTGQLKDLSSYTSDILIVSGGGGGGLLVDSTNYSGKDAGGISGSGDNSADQTTGNAFGLGESGTNLSGGGSGLYGGYKGTSSKGGGAGSGYIGNSLLGNKKMVGYNVPTSSAEDTKTESVNTYDSIHVANKPKSGNGWARIKLLNEIKEYTLEQLMVNGIGLYTTLSVDTDYGYRFPFNSANGDNLFYGGSYKRPLKYKDGYYYFEYSSIAGNLDNSAFAIYLNSHYVKSISAKVGVFRVADYSGCYIRGADTIARESRIGHNGDINYNHPGIDVHNILQPNTYYDINIDVNTSMDYIIFLCLCGEWRFKDIKIKVIE